MAPQSICDSNKKLNQNTEISLLHSLKDVFLSAKQELNNELTKLAIKNLPILEVRDLWKKYEQAAMSMKSISLNQLFMMDTNSNQALQNRVL